MVNTHTTIVYNKPTAERKQVIVLKKRESRERVFYSVIDRRNVSNVLLNPLTRTERDRKIP